MLARRVMLKLEEGNFLGAVNAVRSEDTIAPFTPDNLVKLKAKHPQTPLSLIDRRAFINPLQFINSVGAVDALAIHNEIFSFASGSAGGPDGPHSAASERLDSSRWYL